MMKRWDAFEQRRTIRKFTPLPPETQLYTLKAAPIASIAGNRQAWVTVIINNGKIGGGFEAKI